MRPFPQEWRGEEQELSLQIDGVMQRIEVHLRQSGLPRTVALFSAAVQAGVADAPAPDGDGAAAVGVAGTRQGPDQSGADHEGGAGTVAQACAPDTSASGTQDDAGLWAFDKTPYMPEQAAILLGKIRSIRSAAIEQLRLYGSCVFDLSTRQDGVGDEVDHSSAALMRESDEMTLRRARHTLVEADAALRRLRDGSYGWCEETGEPIEYRRMLANPLARLSLEAQQRLEARQRLVAA